MGMADYQTIADLAALSKVHPQFVQGLGPKWTVEDLAAHFEVAESTILRYPLDYGGVRIHNRWLFFENLIEQAVRNAYAEQTRAQGQDPMAWSSEQEDIPEGETLQDQDPSHAVGERAKGPATGKHPNGGRQAPTGRRVVAQGYSRGMGEGADPHGLLN